MAYTHFRFIAYEVPTATHDLAQNVVSGFDPGPECAVVDRIPVGATTGPDSKLRLKRLASVVDEAERAIRASALTDDDNTLKVFMVPEFYFRPQAYTNDYRYEMYPEAEAESIIVQLSTMFQDAAFQNWLIVAGTVLWRQTKTDPVTGAPITAFRNTAVIVRRSEIYGVEKYVPSHLDGVPYPLAPLGKFADNYDPTLHIEYDTWMFRKCRILDIGGVLCGLEVCLDHGDKRYSVLKKILSEWGTHETAPRPLLSLHLLPAGGMQINPDCVAARDSGYILRNDGYSGDPYSQMLKVRNHYDAFGNITDSWNLNGRANLSAGSLANQLSQLTGPQLVRMFDTTRYFHFPQRLAVYRRQPLP